MIFVTVGTHEQQFNRLIQEIDRLKKENLITEKVVIQTGYSTYKPLYCEHVEFIKFPDMEEYIKKARIVITHGGPASFLSVLEQKKVPIVVPRQSNYDEHVNNHQLDFAKKIKNRGYNIVVVDQIECLERMILEYRDSEEQIFSNNILFNQKLSEIVHELVAKIH